MYKIGVDEAGRGACAGPVVAAAVILGTGVGEHIIKAIKDSKLISEDKREILYDTLIGRVRDVGIGTVSATRIDVLNIHNASLEAMYIAYNQLVTKADYLVVDGQYKIPGIDIKQDAIIKADLHDKSVGAASIIAKVFRDRIMRSYDKIYPSFGFSNNKGYPTKEHKKALVSCGAKCIHRQSYAPVKEYARFYQS